MTVQHSTSKGCPRSPCRDATEQSKAKLSPWTLGGTASAQADRPRTARCKATREGRAKALKRGTARQKHQLPSSRRYRRPGPPQRADTSCPLNKQRGTRLEVLPPRAYYPDRRVVTPAGPALRHAQQVHDFDQTRQGRNCRNYPLDESHDSTKASRATVGCHN